MCAELRARRTPALTRRIADQFAFRDHFVQQLDAVGNDLAALDCGLHGAAGLAVVAAIAEPASTEKRSNVDERLFDHVRRQVREAERLHAGRVDDPSVGAIAGETMERGLRCSVAPAGERGRYLRRA